MADGNGALDGRQQCADSHEEMVVQLLLVPDVVAQVLCSPAGRHLPLCQDRPGSRLRVPRHNETTSSIIQSAGAAGMHLETPNE